MNRIRLIGAVAAGLLLVAAALAGDDADRRRRRTPVVEVFERCRDAVVNISTTRVVRMRSLGGMFRDDFFDFGLPPRQREVQSVGSGVLVHESGYIVTNAHVVSQASDIQVTFADERTRPAEIVAVDPEHDLAVLKVDAPRALPALELGRSDDLMIGETVVAIGNPLGLQHSVTAGIISALGRDLHFNPDVVYRGLIQTDAPINPGNSGGPLLNISGKLIGINTAIRGDAQNIGFAIPVDRLWELIPNMLDIERRERVRFGLQVSGRDTRVVAVRADSPAAAAGLKPDDLILEFNGDRLRNAIDYHVHLLAQKPDSQVRLRLLRHDQKLDVTVPLEAIPVPDGRKLAMRLLGVGLEEIPAKLRRRYDLPSYVGLMVVDVTEGSPAEYAGIKTGDLILRLDRFSVTTLNDVGLTLEQIRRGKKVLIEGLRLRADPPFLWTAVLRVRGG